MRRLSRLIPRYRSRSSWELGRRRRRGRARALVGDEADQVLGANLALDLVRRGLGGLLITLEGDFQGRAIVVLRNPYAAILSDHNFLFAGHHGRAPSSHYARKGETSILSIACNGSGFNNRGKLLFPDWPQFVAIQMSRWLDMATNWTHYSDPSQVMVLHYENVKSDVAREMRKVLKFLKLPVNEDRIECMRIHKNGFFQRGSEAHESEAVPFDREVRGRIDSLIGRVSRMLAKGGYEPLPLTRYDYYNKSDAEIIDQIRTRNENREKSSHTELPFVNDDTIDKSHGTKMVLKEYFKWLDSDGKAPQGGGGETEDIKTGLMKQLFRTFRAHSQENTVTGLSEKAEGLLSKAVEIWPMIQKPFQKDPIQDAIETDAFRGQTMEDVNWTGFKFGLKTELTLSTECITFRRSSLVLDRVSARKLRDILSGASSLSC
eukprot:maker-scaffold669_size115232-snap-gene-0.22 protein:Tk11216 transcript:maker-scaffold669_size115232-snap-gene-0.22-mRNA-1 annotation:"wsc domain-containing protein 1"